MRRLLLIVLLVGASVALAQAPTEAQVKAAYVLNFAKFTDWPAGTFQSPSAPLHVCVLGNAETAAGFANIQGKQAQGRDVQVRIMPKLGELALCHALYFDGSERASTAAALKTVAGRPILTVSDVEGFVDAGGMLGLVLVDGKIRFDANREAARGNGLQLRAQLLSLARAVR